MKANIFRLLATLLIVTIILHVTYAAPAKESSSETSGSSESDSSEPNKVSNAVKQPAKRFFFPFEFEWYDYEYDYGWW